MSTAIVYGEHQLKKVRIHVVLDLYGRYALSYYISGTKTAASVMKAFDHAFAKESSVYPMIHTDRGATYCSAAFNDYLADKNCVHSMSHPGHPWENSPMERSQAGLTN